MSTNQLLAWATIAIICTIIHPLLLVPFIIILVYNLPPSDDYVAPPAATPIKPRPNISLTPSERNHSMFMSRADKQAYLKSLAWTALRLKVIKRDRVCQCCNQPGNVVHHLTYERLGAEQLSDLTLLCQPCHQKQHDHYGYDRTTNYAPLVL